MCIHFFYDSKNLISNFNIDVNISSEEVRINNEL